MEPINSNFESYQMAYPMPYDIEKENQVIAILGEGGWQQDIILSNLIPEDFYKKENRIIIEAALELKRKGITTDLLSLNDQLRKNKILDFNNVILYLTSITSQLGISSNIEYHVNFIKDLSVSRKAIELFHDKIKSTQLFEKSAKEVLSETIKDSESLLGRLVSNKSISFKNQYLDVLKSLGTKGREFLGLTTGFKSIDFLTSGLCAPDLTVLAAGPGEGKSTFALNIAHHIALNEGKVLFFSYEMKANQLIYKIISNETNTNVLDVRKGNLSVGYERKCTSSNANLKIFDNGSMPIDEIISTCKYENLYEPVKLVIVDYLHLIPLGIYSSKGQTKNDQIGIISRSLKQLAMSLNIPVLALSQLNRDKDRKTYKLHDLRDSGNIEQDADNVWFIWRPAKHGKDTYSLNGNDIDCDNETAIFIIEKNRLGKTGEFEMKFIGEYSRFEDIDSPSIKTPC